MTLAWRGSETSAGYYIGSLMAQELAKTHSVRELCRMEGDSLRVAVESTRRRMSAPQASVEHRRGRQRQRHHSRLEPTG